MNWRRIFMCILATATTNIAGIWTDAKALRTTDVSIADNGGGITSYDDDGVNYGRCMDVAVIGAGVGGTYMAYSLRNHGLHIGLYEHSSRTGGRFFSQKIPSVEGTTVDLGGMRIKPNTHKILMTTIANLGLKVVDFPLNFGNPNETLYYLRGKHLRPEDLGGPKTPYNLREDEKLSPGKLMWKIYSENTNMSKTSYPSESELYDIYTSSGVPLYAMSMDQFFGEYASREVYDYLRDSLVWQEASREYGALSGLGFVVYPSDSDEITNLVTVDGGMDKVPKNLRKQFMEASPKHYLQLNHQLKSFKKSSKGYKLTFTRTKTEDGYTTSSGKPDVYVCASKVVLAIQRDALRYVDFKPLQENVDFQKRFNSIIATSAEKIFLAYTSPWWKKCNPDITHLRSTLPTTFTYDWRQGSDGNWINLPSYGDNPQHIRLWKDLQNRGNPIAGSVPGAQRITTAVRDQVHRYLSQLYRIPLADIPPTIGGAMQLWDTYPFEAAWYGYKPGFKMAETMEAMLKPFDGHDVYLVTGSWFNDYQGWAENVLTIASKILAAYFPLQ